MYSVFISTWFLFVYPPNHTTALQKPWVSSWNWLTLPHPGTPWSLPWRLPRQFQSSSFVFSLKRESELGVQKRESELNPRSIFSLRTAAINKAMPKSNGLFSSRDIKQSNFKKILTKKPKISRFFLLKELFSTQILFTCHYWCLWLLRFVCCQKDVFQKTFFMFQYQHLERKF